MTIKNKGFSLIEMVITIGVMAIIIVALATMGIFTLKKATESNNKSRALRFAQEAVEGLRYYRDVNLDAFTILQDSTIVGNYVLINKANGWDLVTTQSANPDTKYKLGCQDPILDNVSGIKNSDECNSPIEPYFKRKIEVTTDTDEINFKITVWWENGLATGITGKSVVVKTKLAK